MKSLQIIEDLAQELFEGYAINLREESRLQNWKVLVRHDKVFLKFDSWEGVGESETLTVSPYNNGSCTIENSFMLHCNSYPTIKYPPRMFNVEVCINDLEYIHMGQGLFHLFQRKHEIKIKYEPMPISWGNPTITPPQPTSNIFGWLAYFNLDPYNEKWAETILSNLLQEVQTFSQLAGKENLDDHHTEKALNELRDLLGKKV